MKNQKSILILFEPVNQTPLIKSLVVNMRKEGIAVDAWNVSRWEYVDSTTNGVVIDFILPVLRLFFSIPKAGTLFRRIVSYFMMRRSSSNYTAIDIHFFSPTYYRLLDSLIKTKKPYKLTIWGSDFYRTPQKRKEKQRKYYSNAKIIHIGTEQMKEDFLLDFPTVADKIRLARFGISQFDLIDRYRDKNSCTLLPVNEIKDKIVITCGYNGSVGQQHKLLINAIGQLRGNQKDKIVLLFPMTYGATKKYTDMILDLLSDLGITYHIFTTHLSNEENAQLRVLTDIAVNIQVSDALSASLQEHLCAGNLLLAGDWLPYRVFDEAGIFYKKTSIEKLSDTLSYCIDNIHSLKEKTKDNPTKIKTLSSWKAVSPVWATIYKELLD